MVRCFKEFNPSGDGFCMAHCLVKKDISRIFLFLLLFCFVWFPVSPIFSVVLEAHLDANGFDVEGIGGCLNDVKILPDTLAGEPFGIVPHLVSDQSFPVRPERGQKAREGFHPVCSGLSPPSYPLL